MKKYLIYTKQNNKRIILGVIESRFYPATIVNDHNYSLKKYGYEYCNAIELSNKMHTEL